MTAVDQVFMERGEMMGDKTIRRAEILCPFEDVRYPTVDGRFIVVSRGVAWPTNK